MADTKKFSGRVFVGKTAQIQEFPRCCGQNADSSTSPCSRKRRANPARERSQARNLVDEVPRRTDVRRRVRPASPGGLHCRSSVDRAGRIRTGSIGSGDSQARDVSAAQRFPARAGCVRVSRIPAGFLQAVSADLSRRWQSRGRDDHRRRSSRYGGIAVGALVA